MLELKNLQMINLKSKRLNKHKHRTSINGQLRNHSYTAVNLSLYLSRELNGINVDTSVNKTEGRKKRKKKERKGRD